MKNLKRIIFANLQRLTVIMLAMILLLSVFIQIMMVRRQAKDNAQAAFLQIEQVLEANNQELALVKAEYRETCLLNAESIAYMIQHHPEILGDVEEFRKIARMMEVDEIHIFDQTGRIVTGSHPEYYDYTFETGEQIGFFKPLLQNRDLKLCQDITPNTAEGKLVQYSALWSADRQFIVQVGMYPEAVLEATEKNELSYIFSLLRGNPGVDLYAIDPASGEIKGSTNASCNGRHMEDIGLQMEDMNWYRRGARLTVGGVDSYCVFATVENVLIGYVVSEDLLYSSVPLYTGALVLGLALVAIMFVASTWRFTNRYIIQSIYRLNETLRSVSGGDLETRADVQTSQEFSELSNHLNEMIEGLLASTDKMSFVLNRTKIPIGVYEYGKKLQAVRFTEYIPKILDLDAEAMKRLSSDYHQLQEHIQQIRENPVAGEKDIFRIGQKQDKYVKLEEISSGSDTLGVIMDVTEEIMTRRRIERERDIDLLTGLYNRRGLERKLVSVFEGTDDRGFGVLILIDSDGLKGVNDTYGHNVGDAYIQRIADQIRDFGTARKLAARLGGDEFVLLLYGYDTEEEVRRELEALRTLQNNTTLTLDEHVLQVRFSWGYVMTKGRRDHEAMLAEADRYMYAVKRQRQRMGIPAPEPNREA